MEISDLLMDSELAAQFDKFIKAEAKRLASQYGLEQKWVELILQDTAELADDDQRYWLNKVKKHGFENELFFFPSLEEAAESINKKELVDFFSKPLPKLKLQYSAARNLYQTQPAFYSKNEWLVLLKKYKEFLLKNKMDFIENGFTNSFYPYSHFNYFLPRTILADVTGERLAAEAEWRDEKTISAASLNVKYEQLFEPKEWMKIFGSSDGLPKLRTKIFDFLVEGTELAVQIYDKENTSGIYEKFAELFIKCFDRMDMANLKKIETIVRNDLSDAEDENDLDIHNPPAFSSADGLSYGHISDTIYFLASIVFEAESGFSRQAQIKMAPFLVKIPTGYAVFDVDFFTSMISSSKQFSEALDFWSHGCKTKDLFFKDFDKKFLEALNNDWVDEITIQISRKNQKAMNEIVSRLSKAKNADELLAKLLKVESEDLSGNKTAGIVLSADPAKSKIAYLGLSEYKAKSSSFAFDKDFRSLQYDGKPVATFSFDQSLTMQLLFFRNEGGNPDTPVEMILDLYPVRHDRKTDVKLSSDIFARHPLWKKFIVSREKGFYRIDTSWIPSEDDFIDSRHKNKPLKLVSKKKSISKSKAS